MQRCAKRTPKYPADSDSNSNHSLQSTDSQQHINLANNEYIGTPITNDKGKDIYRIYAGNPNGLKIGTNGSDWAEYCEKLKKMDTDTGCLFEINLDTTKSRITSDLYQTSRNIFDHQQLNVASSPIPSANDYKPGGTLIVTQGNFKGRVIKSGSDPLGRWTYQTLAGKAERNITIISAYQVCEQSIVEGLRVKTLTATAQQTSTLRQQGRNDSPRSAFITDLRAFLHEQRALKNGIFLVGDFKEILEISYDGLTKLASDFELTDVMYHVLGKDDFATHITGSTRVDFSLADGWVAECIINACYEPFMFRMKGDHRNMIYDFDALRLFGNPTYRLHTPAQREFSAKDTSCNRKYIEHRCDHLKAKFFDKRIQQTKQTWNASSAEGLDKDHQDACKQAAMKCKRKPNIAYVKTLADLRKKKNVLPRVISESKLGISMSDSIAQQVNDGHSFKLPATIPECVLLIRTTQRDIRRMEKDATTHRANEQQSLLREATAQGDKKKAKEIKFKIVAEATKRMFRKLNNCKGTPKTGLSRLDVPRDPTDVNYKDCKDWISLDTPKEIEDKLIAKNQTHFGQAKGSFPTVPPFSEWVDWGASSHVA